MIYYVKLKPKKQRKGKTWHLYDNGIHWKCFHDLRFLKYMIALFKRGLGLLINSVKTINISLEQKMQMAIIQRNIIKKAAFT